MLDYYRFKEIHDAFLRGQHEEGRRMLMEMQSRYIALCDTNALLQYQIQEFKDILHLAHTMFFDGVCYWLITGSIKHGPFCRACYQRDGALAHLEKQYDIWQCPICGTLCDRSSAQDTPVASEETPVRNSRLIPFDKNFISHSRAR